ncbi:hypothetical protein BOTBODRAFT_184462 [Botryobasidium botryosum FD-172 SS1]|uniref:Uncharacterized protein n=1 Tax=Botryobasidium botryosum (strain FD-172 SS1) TaxID=930990 RepID=A0A067N6P3_BOTB1|nr:hypothetical protein BOTBODRAFT_184462 [Botryobasidium botryosum FD-172 SS1]
MEPVPPTVAQLHESSTDEPCSKKAPNPELVDDPLEVARSNLDKEIEAAELAFRAYEASSLRKLDALRLRRNRLAPIFRLPNETISSAFCFAVQGFDKYTEGIQSLLAISSVCHDWRDIALECPRLWTRLERVSFPLFELFLACSKHTPLDVIFDGEYEHPEESDLPEYLALVSLHTHQWRTLILQYPEFDQVVPALLLPAPHLEVLVLDCGPLLHAQGSDSLELLPHPFSDHTPSLRELTLAAIFVPFTHPIYSNLIKLDIKNIEYQKPDSMRELFQVFSEASPLLEKLHLGFLEFTSSSVAGPSGSVSLPRLQTLGLQYLKPPWVTTHFLSHLAIPSSAKLEIIGDSELGGDISTILPPYSTIHSNLPNLPLITTLFMHVQDSCLCAVSGRTVQKELFSFEFGADPVFQMAAIVSDLGRIFPMPLLNSVVFCDLHLGDSAAANMELAIACRDFLGRHPTVTGLAFNNCHESMLPEGSQKRYLGKKSYRTHSEILCAATPSPICPQLEWITIEKYSLDPEQLIDTVNLRSVPRNPKDAQAENGSGSEAGDKCLTRVNILGCPQFTKAHLSALRKRVRVGYRKKAPHYPDESESE